MKLFLLIKNNRENREQRKKETIFYYMLNFYSGAEFSPLLRGTTKTQKKKQKRKKKTTSEAKYNFKMGFQTTFLHTGTTESKVQKLFLHFFFNLPFLHLHQFLESSFSSLLLQDQTCYYYLH